MTNGTYKDYTSYKKIRFKIYYISFYYIVTFVLIENKHKSKKYSYNTMVLNDGFSELEPAGHR